VKGAYTLANPRSGVVHDFNAAVGITACGRMTAGTSHGIRLAVAGAPAVTCKICLAVLDHQTERTRP
jgi:hypothetical protein